MKAVVNIEDVSKIIKGRKIIDSLSFQVNEGEVFGFLGPNGAGKTTTIRMIVGLIGITSGDIKILGSSIQSDFEKAIKHVGAIVENPEMYKFMSGYQNLLHFARMSEGITKEKIAETVEFVGLTDRIHDKVKTYSLGMRQRLGLAQCLLHDPKVLILDEPTNGLDPAGIREIRDHVRKLAREKGMAVIVSSHLLSEMEMMCDRVGIIQNGKLIDIQSVNDFVQEEGRLYEIEVDAPAQAEQAMKRLYPGQSIAINNQSIVVTIEKENVPFLVKELVHDGLNIFSIQETTRTLEDRFLEVTSGKEGK
ncbi:ABC transporter ATP-binding protein [Cytobacillus horneckiae]|uniref:ABC transporter ATP-binding protein n=1 Tax=Cytobacillus horneckiae TaxID=549687 RepID=A0A2N0ZI91_9BACI|nr:ABC transporter ATP-binding protein [Cytobacillus horneckiae]MCM3179831.1 ABC transporter ATP-binding protein [Cytobacillus horneckiae]MEC1155219.1 ABC transporter ATP-binding protein [Cytobacillus horneckiae]MED2936728.1 ABC transporter ATP-binding protein [Cytobacillus horneckiae]PKG29206.1 ABC transporter ATP-binding protein [Cytobacillus horneckiae]